MSVVELFAGKQSFSTVARAKGYSTFTTDIKAIKGIDYVTDIANFDVKKIPFIPKIVWASPECKAFSVASGGRHFKKDQNGKYITLTDDGATAIKMVDDMLLVLEQLLDINPNLLYYIENPVGLIDKVTDLKQNWLFCKINIPRMVKIDQCAYGRNVKKPTLIYTNDTSFVPKKCVGDSCNHYRRASKSMLREGDYALGYYGRSAIPVQLVEAVLQSAEFNLNNKK